MGDWLRRWLVPDTPRRKAWQALLYLLVTALALTAAGIKYASVSHSTHAPSVISTWSPGDGGTKIQGTKGPAETPSSGRTVIPSRSYTATVSPSHRTAAPSPSPRAPVTATPSAPVTTAAAPSPPSPAPASTEPYSSPAAPSETSSAPATPAPGGLRLTA